MAAIILPVRGVNSNLKFLTDMPGSEAIEPEALRMGCWIRPTHNTLFVAGTLEQCEELSEKFPQFMVCTVPCAGKGLPFTTAGCSAEKGWACGLDRDQTIPIKFPT